MEVATQTSLTGLSVLWDINIDQTAGFFPTDNIKEELLNSDDSNQGLEDVVRKKIDQDIIKEMEKNKSAPAMTSIDLNILNEYSLNLSSAETDVAEHEENINHQKGKSNSNISFMVKSSKNPKINKTTVSDSESKNKVISTCLTLNDIKRLGSLGLPNKPTSGTLPKSSVKDQISKLTKEPTVIENVQNIEKLLSDNSSSLKEYQSSTCKTPTKSTIDSKISSDIENIRPKKRDWSPSMQKAFKTFCTIKSSPKKRNSSKNKNVIIRKNTKGILMKKLPVVKKTIRKSKIYTKTAIKSVKNNNSSSISNNLNPCTSNNSDDDDESLAIDEITISDDDIVEIDSDRNLNINDESNIEHINISQKIIGTTNKLFKCSFCKYETSFKARLINHVRKHTGIKPFGCEKCDYKCGRKDSLKRHMRLCHSGDQDYHHDIDSLENVNEKKVESEVIDSVKEGKDVNNKHLKCKSCGYEAKTREKLIRHERKHTGEKPFACEKCEYKTARKDALKGHMRLHSCETLSCPKCDYTTHDKFDFQKHKITHKAENLFQCTECQTTYKSQTSLDKHISSHSANNQFICSECGNGYASKTSLKQHMVSEHEQDQIFACSLCKFKSSQKLEFLAHLSSHSIVNKFKCSECDLHFISQEEIDRHILTHPLEKPYKCSNCDFKCVDSAGLKHHMKTQHTGELPFHCKDCGRLFSNKKKLRIHRIKRHKFEQKFYCSKCSYQCSKEKHLQDHMQTHLYSDTRTFACSMCDFLCSGILSFKEHMKKHVGQDVTVSQVMN